MHTCCNFKLVPSSAILWCLTHNFLAGGCFDESCGGISTFCFSGIGTTSGRIGALKAVMGGVERGCGLGDLDDWPTILGAGIVSHKAGVLPEVEGADILGV